MRMRTLHLADLRFAPWSVLAGIRAARSLDDGRSHSVCLLGGERAMRRARAAGVAVDSRVAPPVGEPRLAGAGLRRAAERLPVFDSVHAWSADAAALGESLWPATARNASVFEDPSVYGRSRRGRVTRALGGVGAARFGDEPTRDAWGLSGGPEVSCGFPAMPRGRGPEVESLRRELRIEPGSGAFVAASEPGGAIDAMLCMYIVGVLSEGGVGATVLVPSDATGLDRAERFSVYHEGRWTVRVTDRPIWELLPIADGAVVADRAPCDAPRRREAILTGAVWAAGAGLPVIAARTARYERVLRGDIRWVEPGDRLGFVRAAARVLSARGEGADLYGLCGLASG